MRCILLILDGLGDRGHAAFGQQTPLQMANTPNLDRLAALGMTGLFHPWLLGAALPSEIAHFLLFGYELEDFPGRGYIEALGGNLPMGETDVALLGRICAVAKKRGCLILKEEDPKVEAATCLALQGAIQTFHHKSVAISFIPTEGIRGIVLVKGEVSPAVTDSNPIYEGRPLMEVQPWEGYEQEERALNTAQALNQYIKWSYQQLSAHPLNKQRKRAGLALLNAVGLQRAGQWKTVLPFAEKWGFKPLAIASGCLYQGLSRHLGMEMLPVKDTNNIQADLRQRLKLAHRSKGHDFVYVHTKASDEAAHTKDPLIKKAAIEALDGALDCALQEIVPDPNTLLVITSDHATNSSGAMIHSGEPVPLLMVGKYTWRDRVTRLDEVSCAQGSLGLVRGKELMYLILNFLDRGKLVGLRDSSRDQPYFPGKFKPLTVK
ncbi:MAG: alkaline phosphatase family protein [Syntrophobacterales bacterium]|jgi:2,3-bisphosphoglycerate-independent phosphoglycerate mutase